MRHFHCALVALGGLSLIVPLATAARAGSVYQQTNLTSDIPGMANNLDPNLQNAWGISVANTSPFWVSDQRTGVATLYNGAGVPQSLVVTIPPPAGSAAGGSPTGTVNNGTTDFKLTPAANSAAVFMFATLNGNISGWNPNVNPTNAMNEVTTPGAVYTGLALANNGVQNQLYAVDNAQGPGHSTINVFGPTFAPTTSAGFVDPTLPAGFTPYNIQLISGKLFVTYQGPGAGASTSGLIDVFDTSGNLLQHFSADSHLAQPWGLALAPSTFGQFGGDLLVGNKANGQINAFDPTTGAFLGTLLDASGQPIANPGLWGLAFRSATSGFDPNTLFFSAGIGQAGGNIYTHGLFGAITAVPEPPAAVLLGLGMILVCGVCHWGARRRQWGSAPVPAGGSDPR